MDLHSPGRDLLIIARRFNAGTVSTADESQRDGWISVVPLGLFSCLNALPGVETAGLLSNVPPEQKLPKYNSGPNVQSFDFAQL